MSRKPAKVINGGPKEGDTNTRPDHVHEVFSMGYEKYTPELFFARLKRAGVVNLIDVRATALSRKKGFSKSPLTNMAKSYKMEYHHLKDLGAPKHLRERLYKDKDYEAFFREYAEHLSEKEDSLEELGKLVNDAPSCVMCLEHSVRFCHRMVILSKLEEVESDLELVLLE